MAKQLTHAAAPLSDDIDADWLTLCGLRIVEAECVNKHPRAVRETDLRRQHNATCKRCRASKAPTFFDK